MAATIGQMPAFTGFPEQGGIPDIENPPAWTVTSPVLLASAAYLFLLVWYAIQSWRLRRRCLASCFFPLETALGVLAVATVTDISSGKTNLGVFDHLSKLSSINLVCVTMHLALPSLGIMAEGAIWLTVFSIIAIIYPLLTVAITYGWRTPKLVDSSRFSLDYKVSSIVTLFLFGILVSHCQSASFVQERLQRQFKLYSASAVKRYNLCTHGKVEHSSRSAETIFTYWVMEEAAGSASSTVQRNRLRCKCFSLDALQETISRYWVLAVTSNPDRALRISGAPLVSAILCWGVNGVALLVRVCLLMLDSSCFRNMGKYFSSYDSSVPFVIFLVQSTGIVAGLVGSLARGLNSNPFFKANPLLDLKRAREALFFAPTHMCERLVNWKKATYSSHGSRHRQLLAVMMTGLRVLVDMLILLQFGLIILNNLILIIASTILPAAYRPENHRGVAAVDAWISETSLKVSEQQGKELSKYVLNLERTRRGKELPLDGWGNMAKEWIKRGTSKKATKVWELLRMGRTNFKDIHEVSRIVNIVQPAVRKGEHDLQHTPECRTLFIAILARGVCTMFNNTDLLRQVRQSIYYTGFVEQTVQPDEVKTSIEVAKLVLEEMGKDKRSPEADCHYSKFLLSFIAVADFQSKKLSTIRSKIWQEGKLPFHHHLNGVLGDAKDLSKRWSDIRGELWESTMLPLHHELEQALCDGKTDNLIKKWSGAAEHAAKSVPTGEVQFVRTRTLLADLVGICLMDLPKAIAKLCNDASLGEKEENVYRAAILVGEVWDLLDYLNSKVAESAVGKDGNEMTPSETTRYAHSV